MRLLQVCNVGEICGGTAACAWSISHAFPDAVNAVAFPSRLTAETESAFDHCELIRARSVEESMVKKFAPDLVLLHNTDARRIAPIRSAVSIQYHHSAGTRTPATYHVACSHWLKQQIRQANTVLYQPVPVARRTGAALNRRLSEELTIGRLCTPVEKKWPRELIPQYESLADKFRSVTWEFVGAPLKIRSSLQKACRNQARFFDAGVNARSHLWRWHAMLYHHPHITETFGRTVAEAMRCGCVPIVDDRGGFSEQIENGTNGFLCSTPGSFAKAVSSLMDESVWHQISQQAMLDAQKMFSLESFRKRFLKLAAMLAKPNRPL